MLRYYGFHFLSIITAARVSGVEIDNALVDLQWINSGGGWLAMGASMGYANLFSQAGLINETHSKFSTVTSYSGATWFSTQLFYSKPFFDVIVKNSTDEGQPDVIRRFISDWMEALIDYMENIPPREAPFCSSISPFGLIDSIEDRSILCQLFASKNGDYAGFVNDMTRAVSKNYGDSSFVSRIMSSKNCVPALQRTDQQILLGLSATARKLAKRQWFQSSDTIVYVSPNNTTQPNSKSVFSVPIPILYVVSKDNAPKFVVVTEPENLPLYARSGNAPSQRFRFEDWKMYYFYPGTNGKVFTSISLNRAKKKALLSAPFKGAVPTITQINGASSPALAYLSGLAPNFFAHEMSTKLSEKRQNKWLFQASALYNTKVLHDLSICTQWPKSCGRTDGRFIDGGFVEGLGLAVAIGQYQAKNPDVNKKLKVILCDHNEVGDLGVRMTAYYNTSYNVGVKPGEFHWAPGWKSGWYRRSPWRSMQIFNRFTDYETLANESTKIEGTTLTANILEETTIDNSAYGVKHGLQVKILYLKINSKLPSMPLLRGEMKSMINPLGKLAMDIMKSKQLLNIIQDFVNS